MNTIKEINVTHNKLLIRKSRLDKERCGLNNFYVDYLNEMRELNKKNVKDNIKTIPFKKQADYSKVLYRIFGDMLNHIITNRGEIRFPHMGSFRVIKKKCIPYFDVNNNLVVRKLPVDFYKTLKTRKENEDLANSKYIKRILNEHTNGFKFGIRWNKKNIGLPVKNLAIYNFHTCIDGKTKLFNLIHKDITFDALEVKVRNFNSPEVVATLLSPEEKKKRREAREKYTYEKLLKIALNELENERKK